MVISGIHLQYTVDDYLRDTVLTDRQMEASGSECLSVTTSLKTCIEKN